MLKISSFFQFPEAFKGGVVAIGNFDGLHRGHLAVLETALLKSKKYNIPSLVLTFEPHPRTFLKPDFPVLRLSSSVIKEDIISELGFDVMIELVFDKHLANKSADDFITKILVNKLKVRYIIIGSNFHFGKNRSGNLKLLQNYAFKKGFHVTCVKPVIGQDREIISSTRIRNALSEGDVFLANNLLGYPLRISGIVGKGRQIGRTLGFPTANIVLSSHSPLKFGIYAVCVTLDNGSKYNGIASYGCRPTFNGDEILFEVFLFDFSNDIYGKKIYVELYKFLRSELKFSSLNSLINQMKKDSVGVRKFFESFNTLR